MPTRGFCSQAHFSVRLLPPALAEVAVFAEVLTANHVMRSVKPRICDMVVMEPQKVDVILDVITHKNDEVFEAKHLRQGLRWGGHDI